MTEHNDSLPGKPNVLENGYDKNDLRRFKPLWFVDNVEQQTESKLNDFYQ